METIKAHVNIPDDRRLVIDIEIPHTIPTGSTELVLVLNYFAINMKSLWD